MVNVTHIVARGVAKSGIVTTDYLSFSVHPIVLECQSDTVSCPVLNITIGVQMAAR